MPIQIAELNIRVAVDEPTSMEQLSLGYTKIEFRQNESGADLLFEADANAAGGGGVDVATGANDQAGLGSTYGRGVFVVATNDIDLYKVQTFGDFDLM